MKNKSHYRSEPPRTRSGQTYPGGKTLRRALKRLNARINGMQSGRRPDRISSRDDTTPWGTFGLTKPGSMRT